MWYIIYIATIIVALYTLYLFAFKTYGRKNSRSEWKPDRYPYILLILLFVASFIPVFNVVGAVFYCIAALSEENVKVDSWLFKKPGEKPEQEQE